MGRKKNKQRRAHLKKFASDYISVTERPRFLMLDNDDSELEVRAVGNKWGIFQVTKTVSKPTDYQENTWEELPNGRWIRREIVEEEVKSLSRHYNTRDEALYALDHLPNDSWFDNHGRVRSVVGPKHDKRVVLNNSWLKPIPKTKGKAPGIAFEPSTPKKDAQITLDILKNTPTIDKIKRVWTSTWKSGVEEYYVMRVLLNHGQWVDKLLACGSKYIIVSQVKNEVKFSYPFRSKEEAISAYEGRGRKIYWEGSFTLD